MKETIINFPKQFQEGINVAKDIKLNGPFLNITICGVGGSALPGTLLLDMNVEIPVPLYIHRDYNLPKTANENSLVLAISYSGNTEETISAYEEAIKNGYKVIAIATGGKLQELAEQNNLPIVLIPKTGIQPRCATGYLVAAVLKVLSNCGIIEDQTKNLLVMAENLNPEGFEAPGKELAEKLIGKTPVVYSSNQYKSIARIWKIKFNENSKIMAFWNYFPELNHNEMVGYTIQKSKIKNQNDNSKFKSFHIIILQDQNDHPRILKRMSLTADLIKEAGAEVDFVKIEGQTKLEKIFNTLLLGDWVTYYLALAYNQDPEPVAIVEDFKRRMSN